MTGVTRGQRRNFSHPPSIFLAVNDNLVTAHVHASIIRAEWSYLDRDARFVGTGEATACNCDSNPSSNA